jgi:hypothetical protein
MDSRAAAISTSVADDPIIIVAGSPGTKNMRVNINIATPRRTGIIHSKRFARNLSIDTPRRDVVVYWIFGA